MEWLECAQEGEVVTAFSGDYEIVRLREGYSVGLPGGTVTTAETYAAAKWLCEVDSKKEVTWAWNPGL